MTLGNLPYKRYVAQVSTGAPQVKSNWIEMMTGNLEMLKTPAWREASNVPASLVDHDFTAASHFNDTYDAYKMTGNYDSEAMTEIVYSGMVAYRFRLPADYVSGSANITSVSVPVYRDRFCKGGVRVSALFGGASPDFITWDLARGVGTDVPPATERMSQDEVQYLTSGSAANEVVDFDVPAIGTKSRYLWIVLTLEDYTDRWEWYNSKERRLYAAEGSARLAGDMISVEFDADVTPDGPEHEFNVVRGGVLPKLPEGSASGARVIELYSTGDVIVPRFTGATPDATRTVIRMGADSVVIDGTCGDVSVSASYTVNGVTSSLVVLCGTFATRSIDPVRGLILFDVASKRVLDIPFSTENGTISTSDGSSLYSARSKAGVSIIMENGVPHAYIWFSYMREGSYNELFVTRHPVIDVNLSSMVAKRWNKDNVFPPESGSANWGSTYVGLAWSFYDYNVILQAIGENATWIQAPIFYELLNSDHVLRSLFPGNGVVAPRFVRIDNGAVNSMSVRYLGNGTAELVLVNSSSGTELYDVAGGALLATGRVVSLRFSCASYSSGSYTHRVSPSDVAVVGSNLDLGDDIRVVRGPGGTEDYLIAGPDLEKIGDQYTYGYALSSGGTRSVRDTGGVSPYYLGPMGSVVGSVTPGTGDGDKIFVDATDIPATPAEAEKAAGLRTLQGKFYMGDLAGVARISRARLGASFSVRSGTKQLYVINGGSVASEAVPVWRMSTTALVIPFAVPTEWRARALRLDWSGWPGSATAGARFNVWLRAGHWQDACPQILESDIPYDTLKAEADGWQLLGTIDAAGSATSATFDAPDMAGVKFASLMLTAFASADGINPGPSTTWPIGSATEVDVVDGQVVNAEKAWLPDVTLIG